MSRFFGMQNFQLGQAMFDDLYTAQSNNSEFVLNLLSEELVEALISLRYEKPQIQVQDGAITLLVPHCPET